MALTKSAATLYGINSVASNTMHIGAELDVASAYGATGRVRFGRDTATALTAAPEIHIQGTRLASPTADDWFTLPGCVFVPNVGASIGSQLVSSGGGIGSVAVTLAAGTNFATPEFVFFRNGTIANSEWKRFVQVAGAVLTLPTGDGLVFSQASSTARDQSEEYPFQLDLTSIQRLRLVVFAYNTGQAIVVQSDLELVTGL